MASSSDALTWLEVHFGELEDPRTGNRKVHSLLDIIGLTILGVLCGADDFTSIEQFGRAKLAWLRRWLPLKNGIPSHDTLGRCFRLLDPEQVEKGFASWVSTLNRLTQGEVIAIDGKTLRGSHARGDHKYPIHMVSAWAVGNGLCLGQQKVADKSNEITAIPRLLDLLALEGTIVTIDAMGTQQPIAQQIIEAGADYVLALKDNHATLHAEVISTFDHLAGSRLAPWSSQWDNGHGRVESRRCCIVDLTHPDFDWIEAADLAPWPGLSTLVMVEAKRWVGSQASVERRYYLSSLSAQQHQARQHNHIVRAHWAVENALHWTLDVALGEDRSRVRSGFADHNLAIIRRLALNLLKRDQRIRVGVKNKRLRAAWDEDYLLHLLSTGDQL